tara:strand:+ start:131 stop:502 length:372 start_codon:yes stop_codon:yes gene_type:complete
MEEEYNPKNIDKALRRMENSDELREINRESSHMHKWFAEHAEDNNIESQILPTESKKENYLNKIRLLYNLLQKKGQKEEIKHLQNIKTLIETTDFLNLNTERKKILKKNLIWCNEKYEKYLDT